jgi:hypothetical protein
METSKIVFYGHEKTMQKFMEFCHKLKSMQWNFIFTKQWSPWKKCYRFTKKKSGGPGGWDFFRNPEKCIILTKFSTRRLDDARKYEGDTLKDEDDTQMYVDDLSVSYKGRILLKSTFFFIVGGGGGNCEKNW